MATTTTTTAETDSPEARMIVSFYEALGRRDAESMVACYHKDVVFRDPAFGELRGDRARNMWRMLCGRSADLRVEVSNVKAQNGRGTAHWDAHYTFTSTGRRVVNRIDARFEFAQGRIIRHEDSFNLWRWSRQALGTKGLLMGWLPPVQKAITAKANRGLDEFIAQRKP
ncbi:MAG TPA: nuclear transport factor 2 family protein [Polyangia bacterium]